MIRRLIKTGTLRAEQVMQGAPFQIRTIDLASDSVKAAIARKGRPCRVADEECFQCLQTLEEGLHNDSSFANGRIARSAALLVISRRPSVVYRVSAAHREVA
jgi:hypothetical protein